MRAFRPGGLLLAGAVLVACGPEVVDHSPAGNRFDADSASLEGGLGHWAAWFSAEVAPDGEAARVGGVGLRVEVREPFGWGVALDVWPGLAAAPGPHRAAFWARSLGSERAATVDLSWRDERGEVLQQDSLRSLEMSADWARVTHVLTAPAGTAFVGVAVTGSEGVPGDVLHLDGFLLQPTPGG